MKAEAPAKRPVRLDDLAPPYARLVMTLIAAARHEAERKAGAGAA
jgi:hypothetical protein